jgi:hypothetical protein
MEWEEENQQLQDAQCDGSYWSLILCLNVLG